MEKEKEHHIKANVTLDPDTADFELFLFFLDRCVLGHKSSSGRHFWEVEVGVRTYSELGVCEEDTEWTWGITESPQNRFLFVELYANKYQALTFPRTLLSLRKPTSWVAILLDYEAGHVSFYSVANGSHICTFPKVSFTGLL
ncbi:hypothetical protein HPG69_008810 [Diceros bicornis minor]|uniref:B30.2/SPRY domain-containing protein n=1 Tax=Diceros bicornis minor TaxID=77932 RepID=A0A7J7FAP6_DICBM|nr:hypothetical protein HPG69_008810 [Diceros bicornis minor]